MYQAVWQWLCSSEICVVFIRVQDLDRCLLLKTERPLFNAQYPEDFFLKKKHLLKEDSFTSGWGKCTDSLLELFSFSPAVVRHIWAILKLKLFKKGAFEFDHNSTQCSLYFASGDSFLFDPPPVFKLLYNSDHRHAFILGGLNALTTAELRGASPKLHILIATVAMHLE